jgi:hypothetical protein
MKSIYERDFRRDSIENASMEVDYKDIMSIEIEENVFISIRELSPNRNQLSSLSPNSKISSQDNESDESFKN